MELPTYIKALHGNGATVYINVAQITNVIGLSGYCKISVAGQEEQIPVQGELEKVMQAIMSARPGVF
ncbi:MAG: hypothetical protein EOP88_21125 [Verrucomicrobiaceae bacterium]|nr:MAG: hypothetical protein EOP88_21125 [Verrucomicrobiaceae bacterium]